MEIKKISQNEYNFIFDTFTISNVIAAQLLKDPSTVFCSCVKAHPHEKHVIINLKTDDKSPKEIFNNALNAIIKDIDLISNLIDDF